ncbi:MAG: LptF/LptG family permease, partial [Crocinitomicaceae bacterium]
APMVVAAIIFMVYFSIITTGENLVQSMVLSPFIGMWIAVLIFTPIAIILTRAAAKDSVIFSLDNWSKKIRLIFKKNEHPDSKS